MPLVVLIGANHLASEHDERLELDEIRKCLLDDRQHVRAEGGGVSKCKVGVASVFFDYFSQSDWLTAGLVASSALFQQSA